jgi:hypothetical protein
MFFTNGFLPRKIKTQFDKLSASSGLLTFDYVEYQYFFHFMPEGIPLKHYACVALFIFGCIHAFFIFEANLLCNDTIIFLIEEKK